MKCSSACVVAVVILAAMSAAALAEVRVFSQAESNVDIYAGDSFNYYVVIQGGAKAPDRVDIGKLAEFNPQSAGNRSQTSIVNGQTSVQYVMVYSLKAGEPGKKTVPAVTVVVDGKEYQTNPVEINVIRPDTTDKLAVEAELSEEKCYVGQPVVMTVRVFYGANIDGAQFNIPVLGDGSFELDDVEAAGGQLREYDLGTGVTLLGRQYQTTRGGNTFNVVEMQKVLIPKKAGQISIEPASFSANVAVGRRRTMSIFDDQYEYRRFMVSGEGMTLNVLALPTEGRPDGFYGLVGRYEISAEAKPTEVNVGDPITLTIRIGGGSYLKPIQWPQLEAVEELAANFKIPSQKASPAIEGGAKVFTQTIRANNDKVTHIPAIPLAFFDTDKGEYVVAKSAPIEVKVAATKVLTGADLEGGYSEPVNKEVEAVKRGLSANYEGLDALEDMAFSPVGAMAEPFYAMIWGVPLVCLILSVVTKAVTQRSPEKVALRIRQQAAKKAIRQLKNLGTSDGTGRHEALASVMRRYAGERFEKNPASLTGEDCYEMVAGGAGDKEAAERYRDIIRRCEEGRYSPASVEVDDGLIREVSELIRNIDRKAKR